MSKHENYIEVSIDGRVTRMPLVGLSEANRGSYGSVGELLLAKAPNGHTLAWGAVDLDSEAKPEDESKLAEARAKNKPSYWRGMHYASHRQYRPDGRVVVVSLNVGLEQPTGTTKPGKAPKPESTLAWR